MYVPAKNMLVNKTSTMYAHDNNIANEQKVNNVCFHEQEKSI